MTTPEPSEAVHIKPDEITIDSSGRVVINNPALRKAIEAEKSSFKPLGVNFSPLCGIDFDWKCKNK